MVKIKKEGVLLVISSPSGTGKTTICKKLLEYDKNIHLSVSVTTRKKRKNEVEGVDYYFRSKKDFITLKSENAFIENALVFENYYGTLKEYVDKTIINNDIIFDIDWQGTKQLSKFKNLKLVKIYLITDSKKELKNRLIKRDQNSEEEIKKRFSAFDEDIKHWNDYDYIVINKNLDVCFKQIEKIIENSKKKFTYLFQ